MQLPNGQILLWSANDNKIVRLNVDGSVADTFSSVTVPNPYGLSLDHRGRLLAVGSGDGRVHVITFPGCSDGTKNLGETGIDCGGPCTQKCDLGAGCDGPPDCASGTSTYNTCDEP